MLNRYRVVKPYRGFESLRLRHPSFVRPGHIGNGTYLRQRTLDMGDNLVPNVFGTFYHLCLGPLIACVSALASRDEAKRRRGATPKLRSSEGGLLVLTGCNGKPSAMAGRRLNRIDAPPQQTQLSCLLHHNRIMTAPGARRYSISSHRFAVRSSATRHGLPVVPALVAPSLSGPGRSARRCRYREHGKDRRRRVRWRC